jgi:hypothetical protein
MAEKGRQPGQRSKACQQETRAAHQIAKPILAEATPKRLHECALTVLHDLGGSEEDEVATFNQSPPIAKTGLPPGAPLGTLAGRHDRASHGKKEPAESWRPVPARTRDGHTSPSPE